jgi:hypothetical protein
MDISRELFDQQRRPRFGTANPERMRVEFWEWMVRGPERHVVEEHGGDYAAQFGLMRDGKCKSVFGPWRARDFFQIPMNPEEGPIWTFDRMGGTHTSLPDGRVVCVGGEHEDSYDPDFCIYNDVVVFVPGNQIEIYGYPKEVFPPTDFHTATLVDNRLILVGCLGYRDDRRPGQTPVYALDLSDYHISRIETSGYMAGWIWGHEADSGPEGIITIRGGEVFEEHLGNSRIRRNLEDYALDIRCEVWRRVTNRNWRQFVIRREDGKWFEQSPKPESILPHKVEHTVIPCDEDWREGLVAIEGVSVSLAVDVNEIQIVFQGDLSSELTARIAEEVRSNAEKAIGCRCVIEEVSK